ncbi:MAG TPA: M14 family zinc carboxypeptidase [Candidatus Limnocylindrales bacterium]
MSLVVIQLRLGRALSLAALVMGGALSVLSGAAPARAAVPQDFPPGYEGYHNYAEMVADIDAEVAAHPKIIKKFSIGKSYEGRDIWVVKISANVKVDASEPEVLFEAMHHAREHLAGEEALHLIHLLVDNYRSKPANQTTDLQRRVSAIIKTREIFIVPMVNPDGAEYDISSGTGFQDWRKNRQPTPGSSQIGTDLNRNWGYKWGCCGGSSSKPGNITYRGPKPWSAPEVRALRDFVLSRVVNGRQQITEAISWHTFNQQVMWPYGYTKADLPRTMTADDLAAFQALGTQMADRNGYTAQQLSDLYITDGDATDWFYGDQRIFAFTIEMYPTDAVPEPGGFYPPVSVIDRETTRNDDAVLYFLEQAGCPYAVAGLGTTDCGPLYDNFETARGWTVNPYGTDTATKGAFQRAIPQQSADSSGVKQIAYGYSGQAALVTGAKAGAKANANDLDGGVTSALSPTVRLGKSGTTGWTLDFHYAFAHDARSTAADYLRVSVNGTNVFEADGSATNVNAAWTEQTVNLDAFAGQQVRVLVQAADGGPDSLVEVAVDDVRIYQAP